MVKTKTNEIKGKPLKTIKPKSSHSLVINWEPVISNTSKSTADEDDPGDKIISDVAITTNGQPSEPGFPVLEIIIHHASGVHGSQEPEDKVSYQCTPVAGKKPISLSFDEGVGTFPSPMIPDKEFKFEIDDMVAMVKRSIIDEYRLKNNYYGAIKVLPHKISQVMEGGHVREAHKIMLQHVDFKATTADGSKPSKEALRELMEETPAIIPEIDPPNKVSDTGQFVISSDQDVFNIPKRVFSAFKQISKFSTFLSLGVTKAFKPVDGKLKALTVITFIAKPGKEQESVNEEVVVTKKAKSFVPTAKVKESSKLLNCFSANHVNWQHRGETILKELKKTGVDFIHSTLSGSFETPDPLSKLSCSYSSLMDPKDVNDEPDGLLQQDDSEPFEGYRGFAKDLWEFTLTSIQSNQTFIPFEFQMDTEKWIEIKRSFNAFQLNSEIYPDIVVKFMMRSSDDGTFEFFYYVRCITRLIKTGTITKKPEVEHILNCLAADRHMCVGLDKSDFFEQLDQNEILSLFMKNNGFIILHPFEALYSRSCNGVVRDSNELKMSEFSRGNIKICAIPVTCKPCQTFRMQLMEKLDPMLRENSDSQEPSKRVLHRYGPNPISSMNQHLRNIFTKTPEEFVSDARKEMQKERVIHEEIFSKRNKLNHFDLDVDETIPLPDIKVTEDEFVDMITLEETSTSTTTSFASDPRTLKKICNMCQYNAKSMLDLLSHMSGHIGSLIHQCAKCSSKFSSKSALKEHQLLICYKKKEILLCHICSQSFENSIKLFDHINTHRRLDSFICTCAKRFKTLSTYKKHLRLEHDLCRVRDLNFLCKTCYCYFYSEKLLLLHRYNKNHNDGGFSCPTCYGLYDDAESFGTHFVTHQSVAMEHCCLAICSTCQKAFYSTFHLEYHRLKVHNDAAADDVGINIIDCEGKGDPQCIPEPLKRREPSLVYMCHICKRKFHSQHHLDSHLNLHEQNRLHYQCEKCSFMFRSKTQVVDHYLKSHEGAKDDTNVDFTSAVASDREYSFPEVITTVSQIDQNVSHLTTLSGINPIKIITPQAPEPILQMPEL